MGSTEAVWQWLVKGGPGWEKGHTDPSPLELIQLERFFFIIETAYFFKLCSVISSQVTTFRLGRRHIPSWIVEILCDHWRLEIKTEVLSTTAIPNVTLACEEGERKGAHTVVCIIWRTLIYLFDLTVQYGTVQCSAVQSSALQYCTVWCSAIEWI